MDMRFIRGYRPLLVEGSVVYAWGSQGLCISSDNGERFKQFCGLDRPSWVSLASRSAIIQRALREGLYDLVKPDGGAIVAVAKGGIVSLLNGELVFTHRVSRGSRPLSICERNGKLFFGEYFSNKARDYVDIYASDDGIHWSTVYRFKPGAIRHVHGIINDEYRGGMWVLTGDSDSESGLWFTDDNFTTLNLVVTGSQSARAVSIIPTPKGLIVPMDSPLEKNYISFYDTTEGRLRKGQEVESSVFFAKRAADVFFASTAAEPSDVNNRKEAILYASLDGFDWHELFRGRGDVLSTISKRFFQYPIIAIPRSKDSNYFHGYARSISGIDNCLVSKDLESIKNHISGKR